MPDGKAIAFVGPYRGGLSVYVQDFIPGRDTQSTRRLLSNFEADTSVESFGVSRDGSRLVVAIWEPLLTIMAAEGLPGIAPPSPK